MPQRAKKSAPTKNVDTKNNKGEIIILFITLYSMEGKKRHDSKAIKNISGLHYFSVIWALLIMTQLVFFPPNYHNPAYQIIFIIIVGFWLGIAALLYREKRNRKE